MLNDIEATKVFLLNPNSEIIFVWLRNFFLLNPDWTREFLLCFNSHVCSSRTYTCLFGSTAFRLSQTESTFVTLTLAAAGFSGVAPTVTPTFAGGGLTLAGVDLRHLAAGFGGFGLTVTLTGADVFSKGDGDFDCDLLDLLFCGGVRHCDLDLLWYDFLRHDFLRLFLLLFCECFFLFLW